MAKTFKALDYLLPTLDLPDPCPIKVEIRNNSLFLHVGPRDIQWDFDSELWVGQGTDERSPGESLAPR